jgi:Fe-Mn family superoxide dismutase
LDKFYKSLNKYIMAFELPQLPYAYDALEPYIDARTMEIHHTKHHNAYTTNLNAAAAGTDMEGKTIDNILLNLDMKNTAVRNNGGGFYNHNLYWTVMTPNGGGLPNGDLLTATKRELRNLVQGGLGFAFIQAEN